MYKKIIRGEIMVKTKTLTILLVTVFLIQCFPLSALAAQSTFDGVDLQNQASR